MYESFYPSNFKAILESCELQNNIFCFHNNQYKGGTVKMVKYKYG